MLSAMFVRKNNKKTAGKGTVILFALLMLYVMVVFGAMLGMAFLPLLQELINSGNTWLYFVYVTIMALGLMVFASTVATKNQLYEANDNELLLSMPIKPSAILASRAVMLMVFNYIYELIAVVPAAIVYFMLCEVSVFSIVAYVLIFIALPFFAFAVSALLGWILAKLPVKKEKSSIVTLVFFLVFFVAYFYVIQNAQNIIAQLVLNSAATAEVVRKIFPLYHLGQAIANESILSLVITLAIILVPFALVWGVLSKTFMKIATTKRGTERRKYKAKDLEQRSIKSALISREAKHLMGSPMYFLNSSLGVAFIVLAGVAALIASLTGLADFSAITEMLGAGGGLWITVAGIAFTSAMTLMTAASVSIEGKNIWISHSLPISAKQILDSKIILQVIIVGVADVIGVIGLAVAFKIGFLYTLFALITVQAFNVFIALLGMFENLRHPMMEWSNEAQPVKSSMAVLFTMLLGWAGTLLLGAVAAVVAIFVGNIAALCAVTLLLIGVCLLLYRWISRKGAKIYTTL